MRTAATLALLLLASGAQARTPVLVELFTAQGCGPCGEANAHLGRLAEKPGVVTLTWSVDYWDYLGWTDTFARPEFAERQKAYVTRLKLREPYTPQVVVDGRAEASGLKIAEVERVMREALAQPRDPPDLAFIGPRRVDVGAGRVARGGAEVWLIRYHPGASEIPVKAGDNRGQTVVQTNVVREMTRLGVWRGKPRAYRVPPATGADLRTLVIVQAPNGGRVIAVRER